jgi:hypothetical protein
MFALGSLLYEINSGNKPFEELSGDEVQLRFSKSLDVRQFRAAWTIFASSVCASKSEMGAE